MCSERRTMMKKLLALVLVLGMAGVASAGFLVTAPDEVMTGDAFQIIIGGAFAEVPASGITGGVYGDINAEAGEAMQAAGNLAFVAFYPDFGGWDFNIGDLEDNNPDNQPGDGEWIVFNFRAPDVEGMLNFGIYDYGVSFSAPIAEVAVNVIPEPMTLGLLGLGALFLRRRK
jgi:hypothetical protein